MFLFDFSKEISEIRQLLSEKRTCEANIQSKQFAIQKLENEKKLFRSQEILKQYDADVLKQATDEIEELNEQLQSVSLEISSKKRALKNLHNTFTIEEEDGDLNLAQYPKMSEQKMLMAKKHILTESIKKHKQLQADIITDKRFILTTYHLLDIQSIFHCEVKTVTQKRLDNYFKNKPNLLRMQQYNNIQNIEKNTQKLAQVHAQLKDKMHHLARKYKMGCKYLKYLFLLGFSLACILSLYLNSLPLLVIATMSAVYGCFQSVGFFRTQEKLRTYAEQPVENMDSDKIQMTLSSL